MMRYQRVSPDCLPLTNGNTKKPYLRPSPSRSNENGTPPIGIRFNGAAAVACTTTTTTSIINSSSTLDGVPKGFRFRSPSTVQQQQQQDLPNESNSNPSRRNGDVLLQWGQRKRTRGARTEIRSITTVTAADDSSSSSGQSLIPSNKLQRRSVNPSMPPPPPPPPPQSTLCNSGGGRSITNTRNGFVVGKESSRFIPTRHLEDRSANGSASRTIGGGVNRMVSRSVNATGSKRSPPSPNKTETRSSGRDQHHHNQRQQLNGFDHTHHHHNHHHHHHPQRMNRSESTTQVHLEMETEKTTQLEVIEWPRIYIALSRKEKEEDFLAMKGTKLPHRPRKRPRNVDKTLQYCFPGLSLSDVTKSRYEVREKKSVKKQQKRRGLKGMESLDSDSE